MIIGLSFLSLNNINTKFVKRIKKLTLRSYTPIEALSTTSSIKLIDKREVTKVALDKNSETSVIYIAIQKATKIADMIIHLLHTTQIAEL